MIFDLQRFAEGDAPADNSADNPSPPTSDAPPENKSDSPVDDVQAKIDAATAKLKAELEAERKKREADAKKAAERLSKLSDDERRKAELEDTRRELEEQKAEFEREKIKYEAAKVLGQRNLPVEFVEYLVAEDNAKTLERITTFEKKYKKAIEDAVNERLKGKAPASGGKNVDAGNKNGVSSSFMDAIYSQQIKR